ncbi:MAG: sigma-70 family RNA polymerase sigma factor, partial [Planctomycetes bacterium]|nr:sigma-70 family RNA polymerase sigma factor [Planctomycetota bacterium]
MQLDGELIRRALQGDRGAFQRVVEQTWGVVFVYVQQRIRDTEKARDLTQDTFLHAYEKRATLRDAGSFFA